MSIPKEFYKSQSTGNDFVMYLDFENKLIPDAEEVSEICDRHFGIGADGLIRIGTVKNGISSSNKARSTGKSEKDDEIHYFMDYYNSDGSIANMCGNGVRSTASLLKYLGIYKGGECQIITRDGLKNVNFEGASDFSVDLGNYYFNNNLDVEIIAKYQKSFRNFRAKYANLGNEHLVVILEKSEDLSEIDLSIKPQIIMQTNEIPSQNSSDFEHLMQVDANFEFITLKNNSINLRVFERGVGETLSCGTGICAASIAAYYFQDQKHNSYNICVPGGNLRTLINNNRITLFGESKIVGKFKLIEEENNA